MIKRIQKYIVPPLLGKKSAEANTIKHLEKLLEESLGYFIDSTSNKMRIPLSSDQKLVLYEAITDNREELLKFLSVQIPDYWKDQEGT